MKKIYSKASLLTVITLLAVSLNVRSQCTLNYLLNSSFENPVAPGLGNNFFGSIPDWTIAGGFTANIVQVNGTNYLGGPNTAATGIQYLDILGATTITQTFDLGCTADITFRGDFSAREGGTTWTASIDILNSLNVVVATSTTRTFTPPDADVDVPPGPDAVWYTLSGTATALPAGTYTYRINLDEDGNFDNAFLCADPGCLLPVKLKAFDVKLNDCVANLKWTAETETNFDKYIVEYSQNGTDYIAIGTVNSSGSRQYSFTHIPATGKAFYRLKMADIDGNFSYSKISVLNISCGKSTALVYPNPVNDVLNVNISKSSASNVVTASLYDAAGRLMVRRQLANGTNSIDMRAMASGLYNLVLIQDGEVTTYKIKR
ncbi:MAG: T9SS type A sorting domain-containing protein [Chitinophagaceae bacterium]|nr:T9SS type A sorting domain-containing protein [Chitinophagaceae bacterium]